MHIFIAFLSIFIFLPLTASSAEVLQIRNEHLIYLGDNNRSYSVMIDCIEVEEKDKDIATKWLKLNLPRKSKVNIKPKGSDNGILIAKVTSLSTNKDIGDSMVQEGFAKFNCLNRND